MVDFKGITGSSPGLNEGGSLVGELQLLSNQVVPPPDGPPDPSTSTFTVDPDGRWELLTNFDEGGTDGQFIAVVVGAPALRRTVARGGKASHPPRLVDLDDV